MSVRCVSVYFFFSLVISFSFCLVIFFIYFLFFGFVFRFKSLVYPRSQTKAIATAMAKQKKKKKFHHHHHHHNNKIMKKKEVSTPMRKIQIRNDLVSFSCAMLFRFSLSLSFIVYFSISLVTSFIFVTGMAKPSQKNRIEKKNK